MKIIQKTIESAAGTFRMAFAESQDADTVRQLLKEAAEWMKSRGIRQWNPEQFTEEEIRKYFATRDIFLMLDGPNPAGMFTLQDSDPDYWGTLNEEGFGYLHRLTVRPAYRRHKLGREMIYWAARHSREEGRKGLRFDCWSENTKLNPYYAELGMEKRGVGELNGRQYFLYEMKPELFRSI